MKTTDFFWSTDLAALIFNSQMGTDYFAYRLCWREFVTRASKVKEEQGVKSEIELKKSIIDFN